MQNMPWFISLYLWRITINIAYSFFTLQRDYKISLIFLNKSYADINRCKRGKKWLLQNYVFFFSILLRSSSLTSLLKSFPTLDFGSISLNSIYCGTL